MPADLKRLREVLVASTDLEAAVRARRAEILQALDVHGHFDLSGPAGTVYRIRRAPVSTAAADGLEALPRQ